MRSWLRGGRGGSGNSTVAVASLVVEAAAWQKRNKSGLSAGKAVATGQMTDCVLLLSIYAVWQGGRLTALCHRCVPIVCLHGGGSGWGGQLIVSHHCPLARW